MAINDKILSWIKIFYSHHECKLTYYYLCSNVRSLGKISFKSFSDNTYFYIPSILNNSEEDLNEPADIIQPVSYVDDRLTWSTVLTALLRLRPEGYLQKIKIKEEIYYIGKSVILDKDFNPIIFNVHQYTTEPFKLVKVLTYIDNSIFEKESLLNKFLIKKFIPTMAELKMLRILDTDVVPVDIVITKIDDTFICKNIEPTGINISQDINDLLSRHIDRVLDKL